MVIRIKYSKPSSTTARVLQGELLSGTPTKCLRINNSTWLGSNTDLLINWGSSSPLNEGTKAVVLNKPEAIMLAVDKLKTFAALDTAGVAIPLYVEKENVDLLFCKIAYWMYSHGRSTTLMFRSTSTGYGGKGITVVHNLYNEFLGIRDEYLEEERTEEERIYEWLKDKYSEDAEFTKLVDETKFVSLYFKAADEFRIHVMFGEVIFAQRKALRTDAERPETPDFTVRNHANGFIFQINNIVVPDNVKEESIKAVNALGLDFGAVDIRHNLDSGRCAVLEVNSAPSLTGTTLKTYVDAFTTAHEVINNQTPPQSSAVSMPIRDTVFGTRLDGTSEYKILVDGKDLRAIVEELTNAGITRWRGGNTLTEHSSMFADVVGLLFGPAKTVTLTCSHDYFREHNNIEIVVPDEYTIDEWQS